MVTLSALVCIFPSTPFLSFVNPFLLHLLLFLRSNPTMTTGHCMALRGIVGQGQETRKPAAVMMQLGRMRQGRCIDSPVCLRLIAQLIDSRPSARLIRFLVRWFFSIELPLR